MMYDIKVDDRETAEWHDANTAAHILVNSVECEFQSSHKYDAFIKTKQAKLM